MTGTTGELRRGDAAAREGTGPAIRTVLVGPEPRIAVDVAGQGETVLFLHGIGGNRTNWHDNLRDLATDFRVMAWDARGYGASDDYEGALDFDDFTADLLRVLAHFGIERLHVVGLSMGAAIAACFHKQHPERVATLTLCDTDMGFNRYTQEERAEFARLRREPLAKGVPPSEIAADVADALIGDPAQDEVLARLRESMSLVRPASYIKAFDALVAREDDTDLYTDIQVPLLLVVGELDRVTPPALVREIHAHAPQADFRMIEAAGHLPNIENPQAFNAVIREFLLKAGAGLPDEKNRAFR
ncbi:alpha/beta fold hydrolase [Rhodobacter sp. SGA-6-6]|uniref:alpha/beta fold hydrolase n=1 Tax=Rhodobacter sp. SGA-6-6 TaxID=2710882 RepID=UPI00197F2CBE|nr:alpha/beta fold hydrolase [Rhodobacter sp. SGA-6-6]